MKTTKPRHREHRTKSRPSENLMTIHVRIPRDAYEQMKDMERRKLFKKEQIFLLGLRATENL